MQSDRSPTSASKICVQWGVQIPLRDGVHLNATVYLPGGADGPHPLVLAMTPYVSDSHQP
jgi:uncharacterized protein